MLGGLAHLLPVLLSQLESGFNSFTTTGGEEDLVEVTRCIVCEAVSQFNGGRVCVRPDGEEGEFFSLLGSRLSQTLASVTCLNNEQTRESIDVALALDVGDHVTVTLDDDGHTVFVHDRLAREVHPEVITGLLLKVLVVVGWRNVRLLCLGCSGRCNNMRWGCGVSCSLCFPRGK